MVEEDEEVEVEVEEEEMQEQEVVKEVVEERTIPRVKTLYRHQGQGMGFEKGEVSTRIVYICMLYAAHVLLRCSFLSQRPTRTGG